MINKIYHAGFLSIALGAGVPKIMATLMLAFCGSVFLSTSTYSAVPAVMLWTKCIGYW
ncbi:hypothetical protein LDBUL1632_01678 [Lactobacillus delbrueckii subsp. bulgaricus CNCM I-1632]|nr:hypothetical protein [Lactobacillus delbrueckii]EHE87485.1 hypothetical protein LDBUL1632_01678 [Lactobacillus delbrueckii subsp. bulgaricus CNCM I-1632]MBS4915896.1 hypothetical protein [Lactobacillus delbrueckii]